MKVFLLLWSAITVLDLAAATWHRRDKGSDRLECQLLTLDLSGSPSSDKRHTHPTMMGKQPRYGHSHGEHINGFNKFTLREPALDKNRKFLLRRKRSFMRRSSRRNRHSSQMGHPMPFRQLHRPQFQQRKFRPQSLRVISPIRRRRPSSRTKPRYGVRTQRLQGRGSRQGDMRTHDARNKVAQCCVKYPDLIGCPKLPFRKQVDVFEGQKPSRKFKPRLPKPMPTKKAVLSNRKGLQKPLPTRRPLFPKRGKSESFDDWLRRYLNLGQQRTKRPPKILFITPYTTKKPKTTTSYPDWFPWNIKPNPSRMPWNPILPPMYVTEQRYPHMPPTRKPWLDIQFATKPWFLNFQRPRRPWLEMPSFTAKPLMPFPRHPWHPNSSPSKPWLPHLPRKLKPRKGERFETFIAANTWIRDMFPSMKACKKWFSVVPTEKTRRTTHSITTPSKPETSTTSPSIVTTSPNPVTTKNYSDAETTYATDKSTEKESTVSETMSSTSSTSSSEPSPSSTSDVSESASRSTESVSETDRPPALTTESPLSSVFSTIVSKESTLKTTRPRILPFTVNRPPA